MADASGLRLLKTEELNPLQPNTELQHYFDVLFAIGHQPLDLSAAVVATENNLVRTAENIGNLLALTPLQTK